ncbi:PREDICTED: protein asteroid [Polistes dominula]|uniref:Protein asteroid n=1 Tax=Polistes dominula TaxID=743375 RepID=A0ABM1JEU5_POLDO|nr:PREDICTED: protein asteroid [Polistes dominula]
MGIKGLTSYIQDHAEYFLQDYKLCDTFLVIDGSNLAYQLYWKYTKSNEAFGGDYDNYADSVKNFFVNLSNYKVTPLVLMDGSFESRKTKTAMTRLYDRYKSARDHFPNYLFDSSYLHFFIPNLIFYVFKEILNEMNIKHVQCLFEADNAIAGIAKLLQCPVLSYDSDFFIYGSMYIPFNTLKWSKKDTEDLKNCSIYKIESLFNIFRGLVDWKLPLAAILIGNDYVEQQEFNVLYKIIQRRGMKKKLRCNNSQQYRIQSIFQWLAEQEINTVIFDIINAVRLNNRTQILKTMEMIINEYTNISEDILLQFDFSQEIINDITSKRTEFDTTSKDNMISTIHLLLKKYENTKGSSSKIVQMDIIHQLPHWFIVEYSKGHFPNYFITLLAHGKYLHSAQVEDYNQPSSIFISMPILEVIYTLLITGFEKPRLGSHLLTRGIKNQITQYSLKYLDNIGIDKTPSLSDLREVPLNIRKYIYDNTLNIKQYDLVNKFPQNWRLYITAIKYWVDNLSLSSNIHIYTLLFAMLQNVIYLKIGFYKSIKSFKSKFSNQLRELKIVINEETGLINQMKKMDLLLPSQLIEEKSITELINEITETDCLMLTPYFISYNKVHPKLVQNKKLYKPEIVHIFTQFQNCLKFSLDLNALLGDPYEISKISIMFNGTLIYNLYVSFKKRKNVEDYIKVILENSPNFARLFDAILSHSKLLFNFHTNVPTKQNNDNC